MPSLVVQLTLAARQFIQRYYDTVFVCDEPACRARTRKISVRGRYCLMAGCRGTMHCDYSEIMLHNQLLLFSGTF